MYKLIVLFGCLTLSSIALAQTTNVLVGAPVGSASDVITRIVLERVEPFSTRKFVVENRSAGFSSPAIDAIKTAKPNTNLLLVTVASNLAVNKIIKETTAIPVVQDLSPVILFAVTSNVLVINSKYPVKHLKDLITYVKANPELPYSSLGNGTTQHILGIIMMQQTGIKLIHVPYKSANQLLMDLLSSQAPLTTQPAPAIIEHIKTGKLTPLAITGSDRLNALPQVRTSRELGYPEFISVSEYSMHFPSKTSSDSVWTLYREMLEAISDKTVIDRLDALGTAPRNMRPDQLIKYLDSEVVRLNKFFKENNILLTQ